MKQIAGILAILVLFFTSLSPMVLASSDQAYTDYLYQSDQYRTIYSQFQIAKNEYLKFKTLTSQTTALEKTRLMLAQRDLLLETYLHLLKEKLIEESGLSENEKNQYFAIMGTELTFLTNHSNLMSSIGSLDDAQDVSKQLESHYLLLRTTVGQIRVALGVGVLARLAQQYDETFAAAQQLMNEYRGGFPVEKQATIDRWFLQIGNKRTLYQQKVDAIIIASASLKKNSVEELNKAVDKLFGNIGEARQYLSEGSSYMNELLTALRYLD